MSANLSVLTMATSILCPVISSWSRTRELNLCDLWRMSATPARSVRHLCETRREINRKYNRSCQEVLRETERKWMRRNRSDLRISPNGWSIFRSKSGFLIFCCTSSPTAKRDWTATSMPRNASPTSHTRFPKQMEEESKKGGNGRKERETMKERIRSERMAAG